MAKIKTVAGDIQPWIRALLHAEKQERLFDSCLDHVAALLIREALELPRATGPMLPNYLEYPDQHCMPK